MQTSDYDGALTLDRMLSENDRRAEREKRENEQNREAEETAAEINSAEASYMSGMDSIFAGLSAGDTRPDVDFTEAVEMDDIDAIRFAEMNQNYDDEE